MKFCKTCQTETERYSYGKCKPCNRRLSAAWQAANREKIAAYRAANREKTVAYNASYYFANREKMAVHNASYRIANREKIAAQSAAWRADNSERRRINEQNRRARKIANGGKLSPDLVARLLKLQRGKCACCGLPLGKNYHLDHIMPLVLGGSNTDSNMQLLRQTCNNQKHAKHPVEFMQKKGFLL